jgi:hypothetical protein
VIESIGPEDCRLEIGADDLGWLARYLIGLPLRFTVEEPPELAAVVVAIGQSLVAGHSSKKGSRSERSRPERG